MRDGERVYKDGMEGTYQLEGKMEREREKGIGYSKEVVLF